jgi:hypothetical protein
MGVDRLGVLRAEVGPAGLFSMWTVVLCDSAQAVRQVGDVIAGERVVDALAVAAGLEQSCFPEGLQVSGAGAHPEVGGSR